MSQTMNFRLGSMIGPALVEKAIANGLIRRAGNVSMTQEERKRRWREYHTNYMRKVRMKRREQHISA